jgi:peptidoglycan/LPS O-acetylase OafA/YrhL
LSNQATKRRPRLIELEVMRGVAALQVMAFHYEDYFIVRQDYFPGLLVATPYFPGAVGMVLFFVLSGFVIAYSYLDRLRAGNESDVVEYLIKRYARLWPLHLATLLVVIVFAVPRLPAGGGPA